MGRSRRQPPPGDGWRRRADLASRAPPKGKRVDGPGPLSPAHLSATSNFVSWMSCQSRRLLIVLVIPAPPALKPFLAADRALAHALASARRVADERRVFLLLRVPDRL